MIGVPRQTHPGPEGQSLEKLRDGTHTSAPSKRTPALRRAECAFPTASPSKQVPVEVRAAVAVLMCGLLRSRPETIAETGWRERDEWVRRNPRKVLALLHPRKRLV